VRRLLAALAALALSGCLRATGSAAPSPVDEPPAASFDQGVDPLRVREAPPGYDVGATARARAALLAKLQRLAQVKGFALGHEDATAYGVGWSAEPDRSDVKSVCGAHPAVHGWDLFGIERGEAKNGDGVDFEHMRRLIQQAHRRGGISTLSWHSDNPVTGGNAWDTTPAVRAILPGGELHARYRVFLERVANYLGSLRGDGGELIPVIFRPYHEHTGSWFWWGASHTDDESFVRLWRFTVDFLRNERGLGQLLFAFSPGGGELRSDSDYLFRYPGDDYVDVFGFDYYYRGGGERLVRLAELTVRQATRHGKIAAITEFGAEGGISALGSGGGRWLEQGFLAPLARSPSALGIAYALAWRNARVDHCFLPYPGHPGAAALARVCDDPRVLLEDELAALE
jgi:mannan endo-1,4-beta-mannosidase